MMSIDDRLASMLATEARIKALVERERLKDAGGGGTSGGVSDDWKASVDRQLQQLHTDVRKLLVGLIAGFLFLLAAGAGAYVKMSDQANASAVSIAEVSGKLDTINVKLDQLASRAKPAP